MGIETAVIGGSLASGGLGAIGAERAARKQQQAAQSGLDLQARQFEEGRADTAPWRETGADALTQLRDLTSPGGAFMTPYTGESLRNDPGYQFGLDEGRNAIDQSAAGRGILFSGKTLKDLMRYGTDYTGSKFNEGFQRDLATKGFQQNALAGLSGTGMTSAANSAALGASQAASMADLLGSKGAAQAAGIVGASNALGGGIQNAGNAYFQQSMLNKILAPRSSPASSTPAGIPYDGSFPV